MGHRSVRIAGIGRQISFFALRADLDELLGFLAERGLVAIPARVCPPESIVRTSPTGIDHQRCYVVTAVTADEQLRYGPYLDHRNSPAFEFTPSKIGGARISLGRVFIDVDHYTPGYPQISRQFDALRRRIQKWAKVEIDGTVYTQYRVGPYTRAAFEHSEVELGVNWRAGKPSMVVPHYDTTAPPAARATFLQRLRPTSGHADTLPDPLPLGAAIRLTDPHNPRPETLRIRAERNEGNGGFYLDYLYECDEYTSHVRIYDDGRLEELENYQGQYSLDPFPDPSDIATVEAVRRGAEHNDHVANVLRTKGFTA